MEKIICPSMMCADLKNFKNEIMQLEEAGIDIFHMDIMDGVFVPNFALGRQDFETIRELTQKSVDVHLMVANPSSYVEMFAELGADIIYFHPETDMHPSRTIEKIRAKSKKAGIALNPGTSIETVKELFPTIDYLMVMTVNPGFAGQEYLEFVDHKIDKLLPFAKEYNFEIMVDGAISEEQVAKLSRKGVKGFVLGTSALFGKDESYKKIIGRLRGL